MLSLPSLLSGLLLYLVTTYYSLILVKSSADAASPVLHGG